MPGLLYADIARIYYFTTNGFKIWCLSIIMVANFFSFGLVLAVSLLDMIPLRLQHVVSYSAPVFLSASIAAISVACCKDSLFHGSYTAEGTPTSVKHIMNSIVQPLVVSFVCSLVLSTVYRLVAHKRVFMALGWCKTNSFLTFAKTPNFITALPLEQTNEIRIGNKMFCKPSPESVASDKSNATSPHRVISIYALVASMLFPSFVQQYGTISNNEFTQKTKKKLEKKKYNHTRGACVV
ncbi:hypothetical protein Ae201684_003267 [Aphanomyces euteiches]|uniref:Uncharacterized protein n=1 Tax=Aphanomyces euteiches TaxID=100861 RepID=A0A6G0XMX2_9STRA|nr:hypothetical protein Ae201684_003267 [Aphanomyces euteiches]